MEVDEQGKKFEIVKIETEAQTSDPSEQRIKIVFKANEKEIFLRNLKHQVKDSQIIVIGNSGCEATVEPDRNQSSRSIIRIKFKNIPSEEITIEFYCLCANFNNVKNLFDSIEDHDSTKIDFKSKDMYLKAWPTHRPDLYIRKKPKPNQVEISIKVMRKISTGQGMRHQEGQSPVTVIADKDFTLHHILEYVRHKNENSTPRDKFIWGTPKNRGQQYETSIKLGDLVVKTGGTPFVMMPPQQTLQSRSPMTGNPAGNMQDRNCLKFYIYVSDSWVVKI
ncbi:Oidioi.mRNA.OKI2018_I69.chr1.g441.t1.cds [Oikopleura dioica]|uniref:Oidioi.mRNA.OKI2018_I69.chr1.g441.t1.cds n=1 Tax=Oikopleura dioica TaxID=34765 RepID=A0ABN7SP44_OIKDI|nr:Oidioi.mRNA.OKI2018_I69.chr1.g441.t1.cds [Oikopleura dioica]